MLGWLLHVPRGPFYSPKAARTVGGQQGRLSLPSVTTRQPRFMSGAWSPSYSGAVDCCRFVAVGTPDTVRCTPDSLVPPPTIGAGHASPADCATDRCAGGRWLTGQSGAPPDSPVNYSRTPPNSPKSGLFTGVQPGAPDTVQCTTGQSGVPDWAEIWLHRAKSFGSFLFSVSST
jgi:hypothetical protein